MVSEEQLKTLPTHEKEGRRMLNAAQISEAVRRDERERRLYTATSILAQGGRMAEATCASGLFRGIIWAELKRQRRKGTRKP